MKKGKWKRFFNRIADSIGAHIDFIRYFLHSKSYSTRFKILNNLSGDWLRCDIGHVTSAIHRIRLALEAVSWNPDDVTPEQYRRAVELALKHVGRAEQAADELYRI